MKLLSAKRIWFVMNCGSELAMRQNIIVVLLSESTYVIWVHSQILMPENYIAMFDAPQAEEARKIVKKC